MKINLKYLHIKGFFVASFHAYPLYEAQMARLLVVYDTSPNGALPTYADMFLSSCNSLGDSTVTQILSPLNFDLSSRFQIMWEKFYTLPSVGSITQSVTTGRLPLQKEVPPENPEDPPVILNHLTMDTTGTMNFQPRDTVFTDKLTLTTDAVNLSASTALVSATTNGTLVTGGTHTLSGTVDGTSLLPLSLVCEFGLSGPGTIGLPLQGFTNASALASGGTSEGSISGIRNTGFSGSIPITGDIPFKYDGTLQEVPVYTEELPSDTNTAVSRVEGFLDLQNVVTTSGEVTPVDPSHNVFNTGIITATNSDLFIDEKIQLKQLPSVYSKDWITNPLDPIDPDQRLPVDITAIKTGALYFISIGNCPYEKEPWVIRMNMRLLYDDC